MTAVRVLLAVWRRLRAPSVPDPWLCGPDAARWTATPGTTDRS